MTTQEAADRIWGGVVRTRASFDDRVVEAGKRHDIERETRVTDAGLLEYRLVKSGRYFSVWMTPGEAGNVLMVKP